MGNHNTMAENSAESLSEALEFYNDQYQDSVKKKSRREIESFASSWNQINSYFDIVYAAIAENNGDRAQEALDSVVEILKAEGISISEDVNVPLALGISITPSTISVPTDKDGSNPDYSDAYADIIISEGTVDKTDTWDYEIASVSECSAEISGNRVTITDLTNDSGMVTVDCTKPLYSLFTVNIAVVRQKQGRDGTAAWEKDGDDIYYDTGNVSVGIDTPTSVFNVHSTSDNAYITQTNSDNSQYLKLGNAESIINTGDPAYSAIESSLVLQLGVQGKVVSHMDLNLNTGLGTTSPQSKLHVKTDAGENLIIESVANLANSTRFVRDNADLGSLYFEPLSDEMYIRCGSDIVLRSGSTNTVYVKTSGFVGINTDNPGSRLEVFDGSLRVNNGTYFLSLQSESINFTRTSTNYIRAASVGGTMSFIVNGDAQSSGNSAIYINTQKRVGIGTSSPATSALMELSSTTGALLLTRLTDTEMNNLTGVDGMLIYNTTKNQLAVYRNGDWKQVDTSNF